MCGHHGECASPLIADIQAQGSVVSAASRMRALPPSPPFTPTLRQGNWILALPALVWIVICPSRKKESERSDSQRGASIIIPCSVLMKTAAAAILAASGTSEGGSYCTRSQFDLQCNYSRAVRQHKFGLCVGIFLFVQKLIFISKKKENI